MKAVGEEALKDWAPFRVVSEESQLLAPRSLKTLAGVGDRLRAAAFAEIQAREAFLWAATRWAAEGSELQVAWRKLAAEEAKHLSWLLERLQQLSLEVAERPVSDRLWRSFQGCQSGGEFARFMASSESRGQKAGERFCAELKTQDPVSAELFGLIAFEEQEHIRLAQQFFP